MTATHEKCGTTWGGHNREHCPACCETFNSTSAGEKHRVGDYQGGRRCLTREEMLAAGMFVGDDGIWRGEPSPARRGRDFRAFQAPGGVEG